jgi:hypothetical protein
VFSVKKFGSDIYSFCIWVYSIFFYMVSEVNLQQPEKFFLCEVLCSRDKEGKVDLATKETLVSQVRLPISEWSRFDLERGC